MMVLKKLLCVIGVMPIFSHVHCMVVHYDKAVCEQCDRKIPTLPVTEEDLFHLDHADPCMLEIDPNFGGDTQNEYGLTRCNELIYKYQKSALHRRATNSKCKGAELAGCVGYPEKEPNKLTCTVFLPHIKGFRLHSDWESLARCVQHDLVSWWSPGGGSYDTTDPRPWNQKLVDFYYANGDISSGSPIKRNGGSGKHFWNRLRSGASRHGRSALNWCSSFQKSRKSRKSRKLRKSGSSSSSPSTTFSPSFGLT